MQCELHIASERPERSKTTNRIEEELPLCRRIDEANRIVYRIHKGRIEIIQCGSHYRDQ